jgi:hypothetical protein
MNEQDLVHDLQRWGAFVTLELQHRQEVAENPRQHIIQRTRRFAPMKLKLAKRKLISRDGEARRRRIAQSAGVKGMTIAPKWSSDPIRCTETRHKGPIPRPVIKLELPDELEWIAPALAALQATSQLQALVVRAEFTGSGVTQKERARDAQRRYGGALTYSQYRRELDKALGWLNGYHQARAA